EASLAATTPPNASAAWRRAASAESPERIRSSVSSSRWARTSRSSSWSRALPRKSRRSQPMTSARPEHEADRGGQLSPLGELGLEAFAALGGDVIEPRFAPRGCDAPLTLDQRLILQPAERGVERALRNGEPVTRDEADALRDGVAVQA